jgi:phospholipid/cholesterol/gamma-HCH transport system ATP-binding protein
MGVSPRQTSARPVVPGIELIDVFTRFGSERVLRGVSFEAAAGRITVLLGPSGVGKTTCLRHVTGLLAPDRGDVLVEGRSTLTMRHGPRRALSRRFGVLLQGSGLYGSALWDSMTVEDNLVFQLNALTDHPEYALRARAREYLRQVGLADSAGLLPSELSAGMRRRVALARALVSNPDFAVLDSFELGVDEVRIKGLCALIARRHQETGGTYLIATQSMEVARRLADDVVVLWGGQVIEQGPAYDVLSSVRPEVHQLVTGATTGPLGLADGDGRARHVPARPAEKDLEIPVPLVAYVLLVVMTASAFVLGEAHALEISVLVVAWAGAGVVLVRRYRRHR